MMSLQARDQMCLVHMQSASVTVMAPVEVVTQRDLVAAAAVVVVRTTSVERQLDRAVLDVILDAEAALVIVTRVTRTVAVILVAAAVVIETEAEIDEEAEVVVATDTDRANEIRAESDADKHLVNTIKK
eukprot:TRINITY_DN4775_c0_g1_i1.p3 TRINITY_DN4775_c0_g1~~TRINITY_DN4775_c0_g1_i1.p3  ORF type:complete len:129 (-),score=8.38 TRINITY_DN4775_c0_g1_i1:6-392(-)